MTLVDDDFDAALRMMSKLRYSEQKYFLHAFLTNDRNGPWKYSGLCFKNFHSAHALPRKLGLAREIWGFGLCLLFYFFPDKSSISLIYYSIF